MLKNILYNTSEKKLTDNKKIKQKCKVTEECLKTRECDKMADSTCACKKGQCHVNGIPIWISYPGRENYKCLLNFLLSYLKRG
jgi:hypothetical protein